MCEENILKYVDVDIYSIQGGTEFFLLLVKFQCGDKLKSPFAT